MFVWETDPATGITTWGDGAADVIGVPEKELSQEQGGGTFFVTDQARNDLFEQFNAAVSRRKPSLSPEFASSDGRAWRAEINISYNDDGTPKRVFGITQDVTEVQRRQEQVRASEARLRGVLDGMAEGFVLMDRDFRILTINAEGLRQDGRGSEEIIGRTHWEAFPGSEENAFGQLYKKALAENVPVAIEHSYTWANGRVTWIDMRAYPTPDGLAVFWRDATDRKSAEKEFADKAAEFEALAENVSQLAWMANADGHIYWYNKRWYDYTGTDFQSMEGWGWREVHHPDHIDRVIEEVSGKWAGGEPWEGTYLLRGSDGVFRPFLTRAEPIYDASGRLIRWFGTNTDISDRVATEIRLAQLAAVVEQSTEFIGVADEEGRPVYLNEAGLKMVGLANLEAACSHHLLDYFAENDRDIIRKEALQTCDAEGYWEKEVRFRRFDDASEFPVLYNIFPVKAPDGNTSGYATVTRDLTEKKRIEAELRALNQELAARVEEAVTDREAALAQLHELKKLETIGQLTGGVAHDFNNLLTPIVGALDVVSRRSDGDERTRRLVLGALQAADRARTLIQRLLAFARRQHLEARAVDVSTLVVGMTDLIRRSIGPEVRLTIDCPPSVPHAMVDPNQLELAILNLAVNAKDAMPNGGDLDISVALDDGSTDVQQLDPGPYIRIDVRDSGSGMDEATLARAVEPFFTTKGLGRGTGLGLSSVHGLAAQSGGRFILNSSLEAGTKASLWLPVTEEVATIRESLANVPISRSGNNRTILLVDDEQLVRSATADMLLDAGFHVEQAESGVAAIQMIEKGLQFDALVTDHAMPGMTGAELARRMRLSRPEVPILIITGYANLSDADTGSFPRLAKPFTQSELTGLCVELLAELPMTAGS
jgi:PAS domain S-box-containing protein